MRTIVLHQPEVGETEVGFSWTVEPASGLYARTSFNLRFGDALSPRRLPDDLWWTVALICLHNHWALLRPCRIELPVELAPGEREFWLRLLDAAVETMELTWGGDDRERTIEIDDRGPRLQPQRRPDGDRVALAFSGGKDSLAHLGLLLEFGERPLAVTTTSPMWPLVDHASPRRRTAMETVAARTDVDHVEVRSNFRECWDNSFAHRRGYELAVNELSDTMLYLAATLAVGWSRGAGEILLASEAEVQTSTVRAGALVQHPHFMYGAVTQRALGRLLARRGVGYGSLTYPVRAWQVSRLLWSRYPDLRELQYSCWRHGRGEGACSGCPDCLAIMLTALEAGVAPSRTGVDVRRLLDRMGDWEPRLDGGELPDAQVRRELHGASVRTLTGMRTRVFASRLLRTDPRQLARRGATHTVRRYAWLRGRVAPQAAQVPALGYRHGFLPLVDERWRDRLEVLLDGEYERAPAAEDELELGRIQELIERITEPLEACA
ncbi:MAG: hypothetical protein ACHQJ5_06475 [Vicinamibacteria bacterium]